MSTAIVIPARNEEMFIGKTLYHLLRQTIEPKKIIVINDGSQDNTRNIACTVIDRSSNPILYSQMPSILHQYSMYVDIKYIDGLLLTSLSKTAIEALACGLKVLAYDLQYREDLPEVNKPEYVVDRIQKLYRT